MKELLSRASAAQAIRILVIEDHADSRDSLRMLLELQGHHVHAAPDGEQGLALAHAHPLDVALIDIGLPGMDGCEVARRIRAGVFNRAIKLIAITGYGQAEDRRRSKEAGFDQHVTKPFNSSELVDLLASLQEVARARPGSASCVEGGHQP